MLEIEHKASLAKGDIIRFKGVKYRIKDISYYEGYDPMLLPEGKMVKKDDPLIIPEVEPLEIKTVLDLEILDKKDLKKVDHKIEVESVCCRYKYDRINLIFNLDNMALILYNLGAVEIEITRDSLKDMVDKYGNSSISVCNGLMGLVNSLEMPGKCKEAVNQFINQNMGIMMNIMGRGF